MEDIKSKLKDHRLSSGPVLESEVVDRELGLIGYVVIDSTVNGRCCGGVRMATDVSMSQIADLARTMTLKLGYTNGAIGGAKVGIIGNPESHPNEKRALLNAFGRALGPLLKSNCCYLGADLGTTTKDISAILAAAGMKAKGRTRGSSSGFYTGLSVLSAATGAAQHIGLSLAGSTLAIEGFGKIGSAVARLFAKKDVKVVAVSTARGAIYNEDGLNVDRLMELYNRVGSKVVEMYTGAQQIGRSELLEIRVDVLSPCAGYHSINRQNADHVSAKIVCPGANVPTTPEAEQILLRRGIVSVPDFIANCGGVLAETMDIAGQNFARSLIEQQICASVARVLKESEKRGMPPRQFAEVIAVERFHNVKEAAEARIRRLLVEASRFAFDTYQSTPLPELLIKPFCAWYASKRIRQI